MSDEKWMRYALSEAEKGFDLGEVPVGAVLVFENQVIAAAHNLVEARGDATQHAEMVCLKEGAKILGNWRLAGTTLYSTLEPCSMCAGGMLLSRVGTLVWGAPDLRHGAHGSFINMLDLPHPTHSLVVRQGVLAEECGELMRAFFRKRREENESGKII